MRKTLIAEKAFSYSTRRLKAGDQFEVDGPMAKVLIAIGNARELREVGAIEPPPQTLVSKVAPATKSKKRRTRKSPAKKS